MQQNNTLPEELPEFNMSIAEMDADSRIFVDTSMAIIDRIFFIMKAKGITQKLLADKMQKSEAEVSKLLSPMHNLTLRMIAKLEAALGQSIITVYGKDS